MLKKMITYEDFNGTTRTEDFFFNLTRTQALKIALKLPDELSDQIGEKANDTENIDETQLGLAILDRLGREGVFDFMTELVLSAYGEKSADGKKFIKNQQLRDDFEQSPAYDSLIMELMTDSNAAADFVNKVIPAQAIKGTLPATMK